MPLVAIAHLLKRAVMPNTLLLPHNQETLFSEPSTVSQVYKAVPLLLYLGNERPNTVIKQLIYMIVCARRHQQHDNQKKGNLLCLPKSTTNLTAGKVMQPSSVKRQCNMCPALQLLSIIQHVSVCHAVLGVTETTNEKS